MKRKRSDKGCERDYVPQMHYVASYVFSVFFVDDKRKFAKNKKAYECDTHKTQHDKSLIEVDDRRARRDEYIVPVPAFRSCRRVRRNERCQKRNCIFAVGRKRKRYARDFARKKKRRALIAFDEGEAEERIESAAAEGIGDGVFIARADEAQHEPIGGNSAFASRFDCRFFSGFEIDAHGRIIVRRFDAFCEYVGTFYLRYACIDLFVSVRKKQDDIRVAFDFFYALQKRRKKIAVDVRVFHRKGEDESFAFV